MPCSVLSAASTNAANYSSSSYEEVMRMLVDGLSWQSGWQRPWSVPTKAALFKARARLGSEPLRALFEAVAEPLAEPHTAGAHYRDWRLVSIDGTCLDVADTPANEQAFGRPGSGRGEQRAAFPQLRLVGLGECGTHALFAVAIGPLANDERKLTGGLLVVHPAISRPSGGVGPLGSKSLSTCSARMGAVMVAGVGKRVQVSSEDRVELERVVGAASSEVRMVQRARIVLCAAEGLTAPAIAERVGCGERTAKKWRGRYARAGIEGLADAPRPGPPLTHGPEVRARLIAKACTRPPASPEGARQERWTYEQLGAAVGMSGSQAHAILARAAIKPHLTEYWIMSDFSKPEFEERCSEICGLYVDPPENVVVVSLDEKTGIQAKAPTKPDTPPAPEQPARREHEYERNGTQCLFAALKVHHGDV
ncbi:MAG: IS630 family transposase, partial [Actinobacteria bacterium]|nr:IS630 family transposase [Actinomycetota bacterium]